MAYDPKDPADKKILADAIAAALAEAAEEHETAVEGLKTKNAELLGKLKKAREGKGDPENVEKLESQIEQANADLKLAQKALRKAEGERDTFKASAETEANAAKNLVISGSLLSELSAVGVKKEFLPAVQKLLADKVEQTIDGDKRTATVAGKPLSEFVKSWSQSDEGKHYVTAPANGGANAPGGQANGNGTAKVIPRAEYEANPAAYGKELAARTAVIGPKI